MTESKPGVKQLLARWLFGIETAAHDLVRPTPEDSTLALDREAPPTRDLDRLWAAGAHLAVFGGLWLIVPIAIYLLHRKGSPFVRWHSFQATVLAVWTLCAAFLATVVLGASAIVTFVLTKLGLETAGLVVLGFGALPLGFVLLYSVMASAIGGIKSLAGKPWTMPIIGRIASGVIARRKTPELPNGTG